MYKNLISKIAKENNISQKDAKLYLKNFFKLVTDVINNDDSISFQNFGTMSTKKHAARMVRNPKTGADIFSPQKISAHFKLHKSCKDEINA